MFLQEEGTNDKGKGGLGKGRDREPTKPHRAPGPEASGGCLPLLGSLQALDPGRQAACFLGILHHSAEWSLKEVGSTKATETHFLTEMPHGGRNWGPWSPILAPR